MRLGYVLALLLTAACTTDMDGDGSSLPDDCADDDALRSPDFQEICDGVDNNCDDIIDNDATDSNTYYLDVDGDGYGYAEVSIQACEPPSGYVENADDCDDNNVNTYPGATELCDDEDNDCDGTRDEDAKTIYYADSDGDSFGADRYQVDGCQETPDGYVETGGDCDDIDPDVNPEAKEYCDGVDNNCDSIIDEDTAEDARIWYYDFDNDGYGSADSTLESCGSGEGYKTPPGGWASIDGDCNDADETINPDALELCDDADVDENCNGLINDEDLDISSQNELGWNEETGSTVWFYDADQDGYGNGADGAPDGEIRCSPQDSYRVANNEDCNDLDSAISPDAVEVCDSLNVDEDCSGAANDEDLNIVYTEADTWYIDVDGDGYGSALYSMQQCAEPATGSDSNWLASDSSDCDDTDADINPGVDEICNDGVDNNCDTSAAPCSLEDVLEVLDADFTISGTTGTLGSDNGDQVGSSMAVGDLNGDGDLDLMVGAIGLNDSNNTDNGGVFVFYGPLTDSSMSVTTDADAVLYGGADADNAGYAITALDLDGDNYDDMVITSYGEDLLSNDTAATATDDVGAVYVVYGSATKLSSELELIYNHDASFIGGRASEHFGCALANVGDTNSDDRDDLVLGNCIETDTGAAYLLYGSEIRYSGKYEFSTEISANTAGFAQWLGETVNSGTGSSVTGIMDFNGDGNTDFVFGAPGHDFSEGTTTYTDAGAAFVVYGDGTEHQGEQGTAEDANAQFYGKNANDKAGSAVTGLGDVNQDGYADFLVGAPEYDRDSSSPESGIAYILYGSFSALDELNSSTSIYGATQYDLLGQGATNAGDLNDDGWTDIVVGAPDANGNTGAAYLFYGPISGGEYEAASESDAQFDGNTSGTGQFGLTFSAAIDTDNDGKVEGDLDGDGEVDLVIGARKDDSDGTTSNTELGAVYIFSGGGL